MPYNHEAAEVSQAERSRLLTAVQNLIRSEQIKAAEDRASWFRPDCVSPTTYEASLAPYRSALVKQLGWPLTLPVPATEGRAQPVAEDELGRISRVYVKTAGGIETYGLLFLPHGKGPHPLVIAQHGGQGTPELAAGLWPEGSANYNGQVSGLRQQNVAVYAPQLPIWSKAREPAMDQCMLDRQLRHLGGSRTALDLCMLRDALSWLLTNPELDAGRVGMAGLSYGGFFTLYFTALDSRVRVAVSSCFVNDRERYNWEDWVWLGSARRFFDGEIARMVCPRPLFLETGARDDVFSPEGFSPVADQVRATYDALNLSSRFQSRIHEGGHEYDPDGTAQAFLLKWL